MKKLNTKLLKNSIKNQSYPCINTTDTDLTAGISKNISLEFSNFSLIKTGLIIEIPISFEGQIRPRSGLTLKYGN